MRLEKTLENLTKAFIGESQARNRYNFYSKIAKKEGYLQISKIFNETADNEREHAKRLFKLIQEVKKKIGKDMESIDVEAEAPLVFGDTVENLKAAISGENYENTTMYPNFANQAQKDGLKEVAHALRSIAKAEVHHENRYKALLKEVENNSVYKKENKVYWVCSNCGYIHEDTDPPEKCPACNHPRKYFEIYSETY